MRATRSSAEARSLAEPDGSGRTVTSFTD